MILACSKGHYKLQNLVLWDSVTVKGGKALYVILLKKKFDGNKKLEMLVKISDKIRIPSKAKGKLLAEKASEYFNKAMN